MNKKIYTIAIIAVLSVGTFSANAQLDKLRSLKNKKDKSAQSDDNPSSNNSPDQSGNSKGSRNGGDDAGSSSAGPVTVDYKENPMPPAVDLYSILDDGFHIGLRDPFPYIGVVKVAFLPTKDVNGKPLFVETAMPKDRLNVLYGTIKDKSGKIIYKRVLFPMTSSKPVTPVTNDDFLSVEIASQDKPFDAGDYTFEVNITDRVIFSMPFQIIVGKNDDPYASLKEIRMIDGYWSKYGCYQFDKSTDVFEWKTFETNKNMKLKNAEQDEEKYTTEVQIFYNGKPFSSIDKQSNSCFRGKWKELHHTFHAITDKNGSNYLKSSDFKDGKYVVKEKYNDKEREYPFEIKDGKPVYIAEQDRAKTTDPAKVFEGVNFTVFVKNVKS